MNKVLLCVGIVILIVGMIPYIANTQPQAIFGFDRTVGVSAGDMMEWSWIGSNTTITQYMWSERINIHSTTSTTITYDYYWNQSGSWSLNGRYITDVTEPVDFSQLPYIIGSNLNIGDLVIAMENYSVNIIQTYTRTYWCQYNPNIYKNILDNQSTS